MPFMYSPAARPSGRARAREEPDLVEHRRDLLRWWSAPGSSRCSATQSRTNSSSAPRKGVGDLQQRLLPLARVVFPTPRTPRPQRRMPSTSASPLTGALATTAPVDRVDDIGPGLGAGVDILAGHEVPSGRRGVRRLPRSPRWQERVSRPIERCARRDRNTFREPTFESGVHSVPLQPRFAATGCQRGQSGQDGRHVDAPSRQRAASQGSLRAARDVGKADHRAAAEDAVGPYASVGTGWACPRRRSGSGSQKLIQVAGVMEIVAVTDPLQVGFRRQAMVGPRRRRPVRSPPEALAAMTE